MPRKKTLVTLTIALACTLALVLMTACSGTQGSSNAKEKTYAETLDKVAGTWTAYSISFDADERPEAAPIASYQITIGKDFTVKSSTGEEYTLIQDVIGYSGNEWFYDEGLPEGEDINLTLDVENDILEEYRIQNDQHAWTVYFARATDDDGKILEEFVGSWTADGIGWDGDEPPHMPTVSYTLSISDDGTVSLSTGETYRTAPYLWQDPVDNDIYVVVDGLSSDYTFAYYFIDEDGVLVETYNHVDGTRWSVFHVRQ